MHVRSGMQARASVAEASGREATSKTDALSCEGVARCTSLFWRPMGRHDSVGTPRCPCIRATQSVCFQTL